MRVLDVPMGSQLPLGASAGKAEAQSLRVTPVAGKSIREGNLAGQ